MRPALFLAAALASATARAEDVAPAQDACSYLYVPAFEVRDQLTSFKKVFGKRAIYWTADDFEAVRELARKCNGVGPDDAKVAAFTWGEMISAAERIVLPIASLHRQVRAFAETLGSDGITYPDCWRLFDWTQDDYKQTDASASFFGRSYMAMTDADLARSVKYVNQCLIYLPEYASRTGRNRGDAQIFVYKAMDKALLVQKRRSEYDAAHRRPTDLVLTIDGVEVLPTFLAATTREMVLRHDRLAQTGRRFTPEMVAGLMRLAEDVFGENKSVWDTAYAEAVKERLRKEVFQ